MRLPLSHFPRECCVSAGGSVGQHQAEVRKIVAELDHGYTTPPKGNGKVEVLVRLRDIRENPRSSKWAT